MCPGVYIHNIDCISQGHDHRLVIIDRFIGDGDIETNLCENDSLGN